MNELESLVILNNIPLLGTAKAKKLIDFFGSAALALDASSVDLLQIPGFNQELVKSITTWKVQTYWKQDLELIHQNNVTLLGYFDQHYPSSLKQLNNPPLILYTTGLPLREEQNHLAIVGTRNCTLYGSEHALAFSSQLAQKGMAIISGLARGIDTYAHQGAMSSGRTIAVIGSGLSHIYPKENLKLAEAIKSQGTLISEYPMLTPPNAYQFPQRNRIVSALSKGVVLIEAPLKSGAMITMDLGWQLKRKLFALPGRADAETFRGNHYLIKKGLAKLIENTADILDEFPEFKTSPSFSSINKSTISLHHDEIALLAKIPSGECSIDQIVVAAQMPISIINGLLMGLVLKKIVKEFPGKIYKKVENNSFT